MHNTDLSAALWITLIGIFLVFLGILLLWRLMELLVRITQKDKTRNGGGQKNASEAEEISRKQKIAAVASAIALGLQDSTTPLAIPLPQQKELSPWQSMHRGIQSLPYRKSTK